MNLEPDWLQPQLTALLAGRATLHHALLVTGPPGIGKEWLARKLGAALVCESPGSDGRACGACPSCRWTAAGSHPDLRIVRPDADEPDSGETEPSASRSGAKPSRDIRIEQIRALAGFAETASHRGGRKAVLIVPADAMNLAAANALLKTLEEPHPGTHFILVTSRPERVGPTVRSRCRKLQLRPPEPLIAQAWVAQATGADATRAQAWLALAAGAPLRAVELAQGEGGRALESLIELIGGLPGDALAAAESMAEHEPRVWAPALHAWSIDLARCAAGAAPARFPRQSKRLQELARRIDRDALLSFESWLAGLARVVTHPLSAQLLAEDALLRYQSVFIQTRA